MHRILLYSYIFVLITRMKILVIGDIMVDINYFVTTNRIAAEANIPVYNPTTTVYKLGGAANVYMNLANLNCNVLLLSVVGNDKYYNNIIRNILENGTEYNTYDLFIDTERCTTQKYRIFDTQNNDEQIFRYDIENTHAISDDICDYIYDKMVEYAPDAIILSDYDKCVLHPTLCTNIIRYANQNNILTFVDPKVNNYTKYRDCFLIKPNMKEGKTISNKNIPEDICNFIHSSLNTGLVLLTNSKDGMYISHKSSSQYNNLRDDDIILHNSISHISQPVTNVIDVTGAGDTVITVLVYAYCILKKNIVDAVKLANYIAGKSISTIGNYMVTLDDIHEYETKYSLETVICTKLSVITDYSLIEKIHSHREPIVFTNGCFDIIHSAHLKLLNYAKSLGKILVLGLNSDSSIQRIKGKQRPINKQEERVELLIQLNIIDYIIVFNEDTPIEILSLLRPDIIVKGGDYTPESIVGREYAKEVVIYNYIHGPSTTNTIKAILENTSNV